MRRIPRLAIEDDFPASTRLLGSIITQAFYSLADRTCLLNYWKPPVPRHSDTELDAELSEIERRYGISLDAMCPVEASLTRQPRTFDEIYSCAIQLAIGISVRADNSLTEKIKRLFTRDKGELRGAAHITMEIYPGNWDKLENTSPVIIEATTSDHVIVITGDKQALTRLPLDTRGDSLKICEALAASVSHHYCRKIGGYGQLRFDADVLLLRETGSDLSAEVCYWRHPRVQGGWTMYHISKSGRIISYMPGF